MANLSTVPENFEVSYLPILAPFTSVKMLGWRLIVNLDLILGLEILCMEELRSIKFILLLFRVLVENVIFLTASVKERRSAELVLLAYIVNPAE